MDQRNTGRASEKVVAEAETKGVCQLQQGRNLK